MTDQLADRLKNMTALQRAVFALKETQARLDALEQKRSEPIAIVGMACRFPGGACDPASYWRVLCEQVDAITEIPRDRWDVDAFYDPDPTAPGKMSSRWGGFLDRIDEFDNHFFNISDREAVRIDPQQRILLELAWEALEDAGLPPSKLRGSKTGVFVGISLSEYGLMLSSDLTLTDAHAAAGTSLCLAANRISFAFGLQGPSVALDTACSSSLVAMHLACQHIRNGECDSALVGGVNLLLSPLGTVNLTKAGFCATDGRVRAFDAAATGYVRSEGAGVVILKPLGTAVKSADPIYAVIRGSAVNQNGSSNGVTAPSRAAQEQVLREAYARAGVSPGQVGYVETQGTGTNLGDAIEATALGNVLRDGRMDGNRCAIGSVKTNIGHLEAASGMASLMKAALVLRHRQMPATLHFEKPNPEIPFATLPIAVQQTLAAWPDSSHRRFAGVSAFGFGGSNAHAVLEEAPGEPSAVADGERECMRLLPLSARTEKALRELAERYAAFLQDDPPTWADVCHTASCCRDHHDCRLAVLADSNREAAGILSDFVAGRSPPNIITGRKPYGRSAKIAFVYGDRLDQWKPYGKLIKESAHFTTAREQIDSALQSVAGRLAGDVVGWVECNEPHQWHLLALQLLLTTWWRSAGIVPDAVVGRGVGELAAAAAAGILTTEEALQLAVCGGHGIAVQARPAVLPFLSAVDGKPHQGPDLDAAHWRQCLKQQEAFAAAREAVARRGVDVCLDIGPADPETLPDIDVLSTLATLYAAGADIVWQPFSDPNGRRVRVPTYPWQRQRLWLSSKNWLAGSTGKGPAESTSEAVVVQEIRTRAELTVPYVAPRTRLEESLAECWSTVLRIDRIGVHDNFLELGGDSLQATILLNRLQEQLGEAVPAHMLFHAQTIDDLAAYLRQHYCAAVRRRFPEESLADSESSNGNGHAAAALIPRVARDAEAEQLLERLDELSDEEVESLLGKADARSEVSDA